MHGSPPTPTPPRLPRPRSDVEPGIELQGWFGNFIWFSVLCGRRAWPPACWLPWLLGAGVSPGWGLGHLPFHRGLAWVGDGVWAGLRERRPTWRQEEWGWWGPSLRLRGLCFGVGARPARCSHWTAEWRPGPRSGSEASGQWPCESFPVVSRFPCGSGVSTRAPGSGCYLPCCSVVQLGLACGLFSTKTGVSLTLWPLLSWPHCPIGKIHPSYQWWT